MIRRSPFLAVTLFCLLPGALSAQPVQDRPTATNLALEIVYLKGTPPAYLPVPYPYNPKGGAWYARFGKIDGWKVPSGQVPVGAVRLVPSLAGEVVTIKVFVMRGVYLDTEDIVDTYTARENEQISIEGLKSFGVHPFEIKVVRAGPLVANMPAIVNGTKSIEVVAIEPETSTLPSYKLTLHNLSEKNISALKISYLEGVKTVAGGMPQGSEGEPLISAGGFYELSAPIVPRAEHASGGFAPLVPAAPGISIAAVIFEDGTYEGEAASAAMYRAFVCGRKIELQRIVPLLESALAETDSPNAPDKLRARLAALPSALDENDLDPLVQTFPTMTKPSLKRSAEVALHGVRKDLLDLLTAYQGDKGAGAAGFRIWLTVVKDRYTRWLSQLRN